MKILLIRLEQFSSSARCNMSKVVADISLNLIHQKIKKVIILLWNLPYSSPRPNDLLDIGALLALFLDYWVCRCFLPFLLLTLFPLSTICFLGSTLLFFPICVLDSRLWKPRQNMIKGYLSLLRMLSKTLVLFSYLSWLSFVLATSS